MALAANQDAFAEALIDAGRPVPDGVTCARGEADPARFAVYRNNVYVSLTRALAARFPVCERLVGADFFTGMARLYTQDHKPASPLIFEYGDDFADFIEAFEPAREVPYLADVARIEAAWTRAYHAVDAPPLDVASLARIAPERLMEMAFAIHPSATLIRAARPAGSIWAANRREEVLPVTDWKAETVIVVRPEMTVDVHILPAGDAGFATALFEGAALGEAAETALAGNPEFDFGSALVGLVSLGAFLAAIDRTGDQS